MPSVKNALGVLLPYSHASDRYAASHKSDSAVVGSNLHDTLYGPSNSSASLSGLGGDDIYRIYTSKVRVVEEPGEGIDSIATFMSYALPANVENLTVRGDKQYAFGNELDNIITGRRGQQTIDGGQGNDVLKGGSGADIFVVSKGNGSDLIVDFKNSDVVRLAGYGFTSFEQVKQHLQQSGANVRLDLGNGEVLVFADTTVDELHAGQFKIGVDTTGMQLSFADEFGGLSLWNGQTGTWNTNFTWSQPNGTTNPGNKELQWYIDANYGPTKSVSPFSVDDGVLTITAARAEEAIRPYINNYEFTSGMLNTFYSFSQTYGYFEARVDMPDSRGTWPAFWLLPADDSWPPEIDVIEMRHPNKLVLSAHSDATGTRTSVQTVSYVADSGGFHDYGLLWTEDELVWYFDGAEVARAETPADMHDPMYMIANLGIGGWAGKPPDGLATPAEMKIDYIRAYTLGDDVIL